MHIVGGRFRHRILTAPKSSSVRPSTGALREALFNICRHTIPETEVLDLFAGSGAIGLEALSRGASHTTFVDNLKESVRCIRDNIHSLQLEAQTTVLCGDVLRVIKKLSEQGKKYDFIFADPPYATGPAKGILFSQWVLNQVDASSLLKEGGELFIEETCSIHLEEQPMTRLQLKSKRRLGSAYLYHYVIT